MLQLGLRAYRFSIAWPRVFPVGDGAPNPRRVDFYRRLVAELREAGIIPKASFHWYREVIETGEVQ